ncbi:E3 ubiquitin-protein ligase MIB1-like [Physella acuta]|uniref:E3 ubiquitin-protein ligase MIB1-like n=1 Tax=Physella acuta TaxID=109671 RepID=UPI0027DDEF46|nr:E3 ubiquitin-protein ligase MIB1-like [Physella acuta]XP_059148202.1 E3 ubiquitin-protein ligase MIB1-like [Physella acuta]XP_059148212.1 E3 ubiquitin-protein ligase MIB1-like [Physella acuta]XP_059148222.1 E3 ubiquitin-protein ligase MIB1-like [Physella acuta]
MTTGKGFIVVPTSDGRRQDQVHAGIVEVVSHDHVIVQWDTGERETYRPDQDGAYELLVLDTIGIVHPYIACDGCNESRCISGVRWKCRTCEDHDLCTSCYMKDSHDQSHAFKRMCVPDTEWVNVTSRSESRNSKKRLSDLSVRAWRDQQSVDGQHKLENVPKLQRCPVHGITEESCKDIALLRDGVDVYNVCDEFYQEHLPVLGKDIKIAPPQSAAPIPLQNEAPPKVLEEDVKPGTLVVRGPDWRHDDQDGGEGHVGTVKEAADGIVTVEWTPNVQHRYNAGHDGIFDLRTYAPAECVHTTVTCDHCDVSNIRGIRWKCLDCQNFDLCFSCYMGDKHDRDHAFWRIETPFSYRVKVGPRSASRKVPVRSISHGVMVTRGVDWNSGDEDGGDGKYGRVTSIDVSSQKMSVKVAWSNGNEGVYDVSHDDRHGTRPVVLAPEQSYYSDHLPLLGKPTEAYLDFKVGDRVQFLQDLVKVEDLQKGHGEWVVRMAEYETRVGTVVKIYQDTDLCVEYSDGQKWTLNPQVVRKIDQQKYASSADVTRQQADGPDVTSDLAREQADELLRLKRESLCKLCLDNKACVAFSPCGHIVCCENCSKNLAKQLCPVCRQTIESHLRIYKT